MKLKGLTPEEFKDLSTLIQDCIWNTEYENCKTIDGFTLCQYPTHNPYCPYKHYSESYSFRCELGLRFPLRKKWHK